MRNLKMFRRADERPDLKSRLANLKARLGRSSRKPGETDKHRRVLIAAAAIGAALPLPALARAGHPDAALLAIGRQLDEATRAYLAVRPLQKELEAREYEAVDRAYAVHGTLDSSAGLAFLIKARAPYKAELDRCNAAQEVVDRLCTEIVTEHRATTLEGAAVIARAVAVNFIGEWSTPPEARDWEARIAITFAETVLRLAGVENVAAGPHA